MREIKFRFWLKDHNYFVYPEGYGYMSFGIHMNGEIVQFGLGKSYLPFTKNGDKIISQQYTGLKDKNGREIYEGDICKFKYMRNEDFEYVGEVMFNGCFFFSNKYQSTEVWICEVREIIGNILENPELLNKQ